MKLTRLALLSGTALVLAGAVSSATAKATVYYRFPWVAVAYLIDWKSESRARVTGGGGSTMGAVADNGSQKLITLDMPFAMKGGWGSDTCGDYKYLHMIKQIVVRDLPGRVTELVEIGSDVVVGGCRDGESTPFGTPDDAGLSLTRLSMAARPGMGDLVAGSQISGPSDAPWEAGDAYPPQDTVSIQSGSVTFDGSKQTAVASFSADGWWVFNLAGGQRAQTRLSVDAKTGGEAWLLAEWANGKPQRVAGLNFVKPLAGAGFGTVARASRMWQSGSTVGTSQLFFHYLYKNGSGERVSQFLDTGEEYRNPITSWGLDGADLWEQRVVSGDFLQNRRWVPLRNQGTKTRWVMENYDYVVSGVTTQVFKPRVVYFVDTGKAVPPSP